MSESSERGREFETRIQRLANQKLGGGTAKRDKRSGAGPVYKSDIAIPGLAYPIHMECKSQQRITFREAFAQAEAGARRNQTPVVAIDLDGSSAVVVMRADHFFDMLRIIQDDSEEITKLRTAAEQGKSLAKPSYAGDEVI